jgi:hypothetical protein
MLLFLSSYPDSASEKDGMMQRINSIDRQFIDVDRAYLKVSLLGNLRGKKEHRDTKLTVYRLNLFLHIFAILRLILRASCVYVHSIGNVLALLPVYLFRKVVTDMHGAVPEEFQLAGKPSAAARYAPVERVAVTRSRAIVTVSRAMAEHLKAKYRLPDLPYLNVPIFDEVTLEREERDAAAKPAVIYAGGAQAWQNVELMLDAMAKVQGSCDFVILTGDSETFRSKLLERKISGVTVASVPKEEVYGYYARSDYGFVLRDDTVVNRVACPTKLVEYLSCGVIPIVIQPVIGDFDFYGYSYLTVEKFIRGEFPTAAEAATMRNNNYRVIRSMKDGALLEMRRLVELCRDREASAR